LRPDNGLRATADLLRRIRLMLAVQSCFEKYSAFAVGQITFTSSPRPAPTRGALAIVTNAGRDAMDADAPLTNGDEADGEVVWSRHPDAGVRLAERSADDGG
jgi:hypothetical protein